MYLPTQGATQGEQGEHGDLKVCSEELIDRVLTAATNVHREMGPGLLESVYKRALMIEFAEAKIPAEREVEIRLSIMAETSVLGFGPTSLLPIAYCLSSSVST